MAGYAVFVTVMWLMWIIENGFKGRKIRQYEDVTRTQAKRIRHLEQELRINEGKLSREELVVMRGPVGNLNS